MKSQYDRRQVKLARHQAKQTFVMERAMRVRQRPRHEERPVPIAESTFTSELRETRMAEQKGCCAICRVVLNQPNQPATQACADHCHKTGQARGILCVKCNTGLGMFYDNPRLLMRAINYLWRFVRAAVSRDRASVDTD